MQSRRKINLTIDTAVLSAVEEAARQNGTAKSRIVQEAMELWLQRQNERLMARAYDQMAEEDREMVDMAFEAQREVLP